MSPTPISLSHFLPTQLALLNAERTVDTLQSHTLISSLPPSVLARQYGLAILNLSISSQRTGMGGKTIIELEIDPSLVSSNSSKSKNKNASETKEATGSLFTPHSIRTGDIVRIEIQPSGAAKKREKTELKEKGVEGVVTKVTDGRVAIALGGGKRKANSNNDDDKEISAIDKLISENKRLWVIKVANDITYVRMEKAISTLQTLHDQEKLSHLQKILFGHANPSPLPSSPSATPLTFFDKNLNESQKEAVQFALDSPEIALIHGPPGTGKTQTLIEIITQLVTRNNLRALVCGPSNISVDNMILRLPPQIPSIRLGHPARLLPAVLNKSLEILIQTSEAGEIVKDVRKDMDSRLSSLLAKGKSRIRNAKERREGWLEMNALRAEFRERERRCTRDLIKSSKVVVATLHGAGSRMLYGERFDVLVIDEGSQALEAQCWIPLLLNALQGGGISKVVLAGDHLQLPPTVKSTTYANRNPKPQTGVEQELPTPSLPKDLPSNIPTSLSTTLFSRLLSLHGNGIKRLLTTQYRMHTKIMTFPSITLYENKLIAAPSVANHLLRDLPGIEDTEDTREPVIFIDTQGGEFPEKQDSSSASADGKKDNQTRNLLTESKSNPLEALLVAQHVKKLVRAGVPQSAIAVITPYAAQLSILSQLIRSSFSSDSEAADSGSLIGEYAQLQGRGLGYEEIELGTVDSYQGREKEVVVISLVRSNEEGEVGFLSDRRRLNVAMTRGRRALVVVGNGETVGSGGGWSRNGGNRDGDGKGISEFDDSNNEESNGREFLKKWIEWLETEAEVRYPNLEEVLRGGG